MDPFVVISLGRKTYRTRVIRHNLNPVYDEKLVFQVAKHETNFSLAFSVVDRDNFSGNDYVGRVDLPLEKIIALAPEADPQTGLYHLPEWPDGTATPTPDAAAKKSRFRLPLSRSASSQSLSKAASRATPQRELSSSTLHPDDVPTSQPPTQAPPTSNPGEAFNFSDLQNSLAGESIDNGLKPFVLPLALKNKDKWGDKSPALFIRAKYLPYMALRQQFWRALLRQYDADDSQRIDKVELTTMLDSLGSTLHESTIDKFFHRFPEDSPGEVPSLSFDEAVICLEDELKRTSKNQSSLLRPMFGHQDSYASTMDDSGTATPSAAASIGNLSAEPSQESTMVSSMDPAGQDQLANDANDLADDRDEEHVIEIRECPICHQPRLNKRSDSDIITHIATCASQDWRQVNNIVMAGFVTASQAQRKWYSKIVTKISYGGYKLGANSANILVQDRITGQINEEKMSVYVRLGIRLLYKGLKSSSMERKRSKFD
jgi:phosphatidylserine decarboxylase